MAVIIKNVDSVSHTYAGQIIAAGGQYTVNEFEENRFASDDDLLADIGSGLAVVNDGVYDISGVSNQINYLKKIFPKNVDNRPVNHSTPRRLGTVTYFTGAGDDQATEYSIGGASGQSIVWHHEVGQSMTETLYIDLNCIENQTYLHAGLLQWKGALNDEATCEIVPKITTYTTGSGFDYTLYGGYLIVPTAPGAGDVDVAVNDRVLVEVPLNEFGNYAGAGYFDADWNISTKQWDNFAPNYTGTGRFNMFAVEVTLDRFANRLPMLGDGISPLGTHDASMFGHNNRGKYTIKTMGADHEWWGNSWLILHRKKTS
jgi:hypothetical protein